MSLFADVRLLSLLPLFLSRHEGRLLTKSFFCHRDCFDLARVNNTRNLERGGGGEEDS